MGKLVQIVLCDLWLGLCCLVTQALDIEHWLMFISQDKTSVVINNKHTTVPGSDEVSVSKNFKENNPPDGKKMSLH